MRPLAVIVTLVSPGWALALVNPNFTPHHLGEQSDLIHVVTIDHVDVGRHTATLRWLEALKGKAAGKAIVLDFKKTAAGPDGPRPVNDVAGLLASNKSRSALLFATTDPGADRQGLLHVEGCWLRLAKAAGPGGWRVERVDASLNGTFNGGTDMLIATMRFILKFPGRVVMPVDAGVNWDLHTKLGRLPAPATMVAAADVNGDGKLDVCAASPGGDRVFLNRGGTTFDEMPGLKAASLAGAWADFDGDGRLDLASVGKKGLVLYLQVAGGTFRAKRVPAVGTTEIARPTLSVIDVDIDGRPDLALGLGPLPIALRNVGAGRFVPVPLKAGEAWQAWGQAGPCVVADFDNDGFTDLVQCFENEGLFFRGTAEGRFQSGTPCGAARGKAKGRRASIADLDGDGFLDILLVGGGRTPNLLHNRGAAPGHRFQQAMHLSGETNYLIQAGASCAAIGDFNHDTFPDLFVGYGEEPCQFFFNRGFRSFAAAGPLRPPEDEIRGVDKGQTAARWADVDGDGALDLIFALANGDLYCSITTLGQMEAPMCLRVTPGARLKYAGPVQVRFFVEGHCLGVRRTGRFLPPALMAITEPGEYVVKWTLPGRREQSRHVIVEQETVDLVIGRTTTNRATRRAE